MPNSVHPESVRSVRSPSSPSGARPGPSGPSGPTSQFRRQCLRRMSSARNKHSARAGLCSTQASYESSDHAPRSLAARGRALLQQGRTLLCVHVKNTQNSRGKEIYFMRLASNCKLAARTATAA